MTREQLEARIEEIERQLSEAYSKWLEIERFELLIELKNIGQGSTNGKH